MLKIPVALVVVADVPGHALRAARRVYNPADAPARVDPLDRLPCLASNPIVKPRRCFCDGAISVEEGQKVKLISWIALVVCGPLVVYPAAWIIADLQGKASSLSQFLELGDILLLDLLLLFGMIDMTIQAGQTKAPRTPKATGKGPVKIVGKLGLMDYVSLAASFLFILVLAPVYGMIILDRLKILLILAPERLAWLYGLSYPCFAFFCGSRYYRLLRLNLV
jgi:hypothetical protein